MHNFVNGIILALTSILDYHLPTHFDFVLFQNNFRFFHVIYKYGMIQSLSQVIGSQYQLLPIYK